MKEPMMFVCMMKKSDYYKYDMYTEKEFHETVDRYNKECGGVRWAKLINYGTGESILEYREGQKVQKKMNNLTENEQKLIGAVLLLKGIIEWHAENDVSHLVGMDQHYINESMREIEKITGIKADELIVRTNTVDGETPHQRRTIIETVVQRQDK